MKGCAMGPCLRSKRFPPPAIELETRACCSKLTTSRVNVSLKFRTLISEIYASIFVEKNVRSFCSAKASLIYSTNNTSVFGYKVVKP